jgi:hypothetical protein
MAAMCIERMERKGAAGPPVICWARMQGLGRGQAASYGAPCTNQTAEFNTRRLKEQCKAEAGAPLVLIQPIPELDQQCLISSKVSSICFSLYLIRLTLWPTAVSLTQQPPASSIQDNTLSGASLDFSVLAAYTTQLILHAVSCQRHKHHKQATNTGPLTCAVSALSRFLVPARGTVMFRKGPPHTHRNRCTGDIITSGTPDTA